MLLSVPPERSTSPEPVGRRPSEGAAKQSSSLHATQSVTDREFEQLLECRKRLRQRAERLAADTAELEARQRALAERHGGANAQPTDKVKLNVGGKRVLAYRGTLTQFPGTNLEALFSGRWESRLARDRHRRIFLDVNHYCFMKVLEFLVQCKQSPPVAPPLPEVPAEHREGFDRLFAFFGLAELFLLHPSPSPRAESAILSDAQQQQLLLDWLDPTASTAATATAKTLRPLYRASRDGWASAQFHTQCDAQGPTVTIVKTVAGTAQGGGFIFGGYTDQPWSASGSYVASADAFLFALHVAAGTPPMKLPLRGASDANAILCQSNIGPTFGSGHDLLVASGANSNTSSSSNLGRSFVLPAGQSATAFFTGGQHFQAAEVEVFAVVDQSAAAAEGAAGSDEHGQAWEADFGALVGKGSLADALEKARARATHSYARLG